MGVGRSGCGGCVVPCRFPPQPTRSLRSLLEDGGSTLNYAETTISGGIRSTTTRATDGEILVAAKLHSGRKTDLADVLAAIPAIDLDGVESHLHRGDFDALRSQLSEAQAFVEEGGLDHRFKSMFGQSSASADDIS